MSVGVSDVRQYTAQPTCWLGQAEQGYLQFTDERLDTWTICLLSVTQYASSLRHC